jgi:DNA-binding MarR family transcriptional regulator
MSEFSHLLLDFFHFTTYIVHTKVVYTGIIMSILEDLNVSEFKSPYLKSVLNVLFTGNWLTSGINRALKPLELSEPQFNTLTIVYEKAGMPISMSEIQAGMIQKESNVSRIVDKLHNRGWVIRKLCSENRRKVDVVITDKGRTVFKDASRRVMAFHNPMMKKLTVKEYEVLSDILDKLRSKE